MEENQQENNPSVNTPDYKAMYEALKSEHDTLRTEHETLANNFNELKSDYTSFCNGFKQQDNVSKRDEFDELCHQKFDRYRKDK